MQCQEKSRAQLASIFFSVWHLKVVAQNLTSGMQKDFGNVKQIVPPKEFVPLCL